MEVLTAEQMREADRYTIANTPISSIDLMERAAMKCSDWFVQNVDKERYIHIFCGPGNNGGDGLALARLVKQLGYEVKATLLHIGSSISTDCMINLERAKTIDNLYVEEIETVPYSISFPHNTVIIDALFGTGLSRNVTGEAAKLIRLLNKSGHRIISIDMPSGIYSDKTSLITGNEIIKAYKTITFQYLKPALLLPENAQFFGDVEVLEIGLLPEGLKGLKINFHQTDLPLIRSLYKPRKVFSHKGTFGHGLLVCGGEGKIGAAVLAANSFLRSGAGLLTMMIPDSGVKTIHSSAPEAMVHPYPEKAFRASLMLEHSYSAAGIGPGIGTDASSKDLVDKLLNDFHDPIVIDADALNVVSQTPELLNRLPENSILTPHPGEFKRLCGGWSNDFEKINLQREMAVKYKIFVVLKGRNTSIACPDGKTWFNPTGNAGMAKGGSGDVLTGLLTGLLASGYNSFATAVLGVYLHGLAGDLAAIELTQEGMTAGDIVRFLPEAWKHVVND